MSKPMRGADRNRRKADRAASSQIQIAERQRRQRARRAIDLLESWAHDESGYDESTWPKLKRSLERDRLSSRRLFHA